MEERHKQSATERTPAVESWEVETVLTQLPQFSREQIEQALVECRRELGAAKGHEGMMQCVEARLKETIKSHETNRA